VLRPAIQRTMPPGAGGSLEGDPHPAALLAMCTQPPAPPVDSWAGTIWRSMGAACSGESCPGWQRLDNNTRTVAVAAGGDRLYQLHGDGRVWRSTGASCPGWAMLDNNPATIALAASADRLYQLHRDGRIWRSTGAACAGERCPGWVMLDANGQTRDIAAGGELYQRHADGGIWEAAGQP
jgi:hypothetical protein